MQSTFRNTAMLLAAMAAGYLGGLMSQSSHPAMAQATPAPAPVTDEVRAKKITLVDDKGTVRAALALGKDGGPGLFLFDGLGIERCELSVGKNGSCLSLLDEVGDERGEFSMGASGPGLFLLDTLGKERGHFSLSADGPGLVLKDSAGKPRGEFGVTADAPSLDLRDATGKVTWSPQ